MQCALSCFCYIDHAEAILRNYCVGVSESDLHIFTTLELKFMQKFWSRYGRKIWLTEFAMCCTHDVKEVEDFVRVLLKSIDKRKSQNQSAQCALHILKKTSGNHSAARRGWLCLPLLLVHNKASARSTRNQSFPVFRYSHDGGNGGNWFLDGSANALFVPDSDQLSSVGQLYNEL